jgi:hypothetical protein
VGSKHGSIWNGITQVQENLDSQEATYNKRLNALVATRVGDLLAKEAHVITNKTESDCETQIQDQQQLWMAKQIKVLQAHAQASVDLNAAVGALQ